MEFILVMFLKTSFDEFLCFKSFNMSAFLTRQGQFSHDESEAHADDVPKKTKQGTKSSPICLSSFLSATTAATDLGTKGRCRFTFIFFEDNF